MLTYISNLADSARGRSHILDDLAWFGIIFFIGLFGLPGMSMIELTCGFVLGFVEAFILSLVAVTSVSLVAFWVGRFLFRDMLKSYLEEDSDATTFKKALKSIERRNGIGLLVLFRLMFVPLFVKNYGPSVINTKFSDYSIAVVVTTPLYVGLLTFLGSQAKTIADIATGKVTDPSSGFTWIEIAPLVVSILAGIAFTVLAYVEFKKLTAEDGESTTEEEASLMEGPVALVAQVM